MKITNKMRLLAVLFAAVMVCSIFTACINEPGVETTAPQKNEVTESRDQTTDTNEKEDATTSGSATVDTTEPAESTAEIVETTNPEESSSQVTETTEATETDPEINETTGEEKDTTEATETTAEADDTVETDCQHVEVVDEAKAPTCENTGLTEGKHCSACGDVLVAQTVVDALGHEMVVDSAVEPTCTATGLTEGTHCSRCEDKTTAQIVVDALGHDMVVDSAVEPTCTATGLTEGAHCSRCDDKTTAQIVVDALGHDMADATCTAPATCKNECGHTEGEALGHDVKETYADEGSVRTYTKACVNCGGEKEYEYTVTFGEKKPNVYLSPIDLVKNATANTANNIGGAEISADGTFLTVTNEKDKGDGYFLISDQRGTAVGQYMIIKYRTTSADRWELGAMSKDQSWGWFYVDPIANGDWQTVVIDLSKTPDNQYVADGEGKYYVKAIRWDIMNVKSADEKSVDVAFVAIGDDLDKLLDINGTKNGEYKYYKYFDSNKVATDVRPVSMYFNLTSPSGIKGAYSCAQEFDKALNTSTTAGKERNLYYQGWVAVDAEVTGIQFRVVTTDGASEWKTPDPYVNSGGAVLSFNESTDNGVLNNSQVVNYPNRIAYNFWGWANLSEYAGQTVTVEYAMVTADGDIIPFYTCNTVAVAK